MTSYLTTFLAFFTLFCAPAFHAQFTYIEVGVNNTNVIYGTNLVNSFRTDYHGLSLRLNAISRITRNIGIGGEVSIPLLQGNSFSFRNSRTLTDGEFTSFETAQTNIYSPQEFDYKFKNSIVGTFLGRFYFSTKLNPYLDIKFSYLNVTELFVFKRAYIPSIDQFGQVVPGIPESDLKYEKIHKLIVPGFTMGLQPHLNDNLFFNLNLGMDFYRFESGGFSYPIIYSQDQLNYSDKIVVLESMARNTKIGVSINLGFGYFF
jgi:hypothetical protein